MSISKLIYMTDSDVSSGPQPDAAAVAEAEKCVGQEE